MQIGAITHAAAIAVVVVAAMTSAVFLPAVAATKSKNSHPDGPSVTAAHYGPLHFVPTSVGQYRHWTFDDLGQTTSAKGELDISLQGLAPANSRVVRYEFIVDKIITGSGHMVPLKKNRQFQPLLPFVQWKSQKARRFSGKLRLDIKVPLWQPIQSIAELQGRLRMLVPAGPAKQVVLSNFTGIAGRRIRIDNLGEGLWLKVTKYGLQVGELEVDFSDRAFTLLAQVRTLSREGVLIGSDYGPTSTGDPTINEVRCSDFNPADGGRAILYFWPGLKPVDIPFTVQNIPMPSTPKPRLTIDVTPQAPPASQPGDLKLEIKGNSAPPAPH